MAQRQSLAWTELRVGLLVIFSFLLLVAAIFFIGGESGIFTKKITVTAYFPSANGLRSGAEVWLEGVMIGNVQSVRIATEPGPDHSVDVEMRLDARYQNIIRDDSMISISTIGLLGDKNVELTRGTEAGNPVGDGGILRGSEAGDIRRIITGTDDLLANLKVLSDKIVSISDSVDKGEGTLGKLLSDSSIHDHLDQTVLEAQSLVKDIRTGSGTAGRLIQDDELYRGLNGLLDRGNELFAKIESGNGTAGKLLNDPELYDRTVAVITKFSTLADSVERGEGTLGKFVKDDGLYEDTRAAINRMNTLIAAIENGEGTAGKLIKDPTLFNSLNETASEIQKLIYDMRQDPRKYLTINFRLF